MSYTDHSESATNSRHGKKLIVNQNDDRVSFQDPDNPRQFLISDVAVSIDDWQ